MPQRDFQDLVTESFDPALPMAVLHAIAASPGWSLLPAELAVLTSPGWALEAAYRQGLPCGRLRVLALELVAAADACPKPWPARTQRLQQAIEALREATVCPVAGQLRA
jgi:hypothetical protein